jgi:peptidoglycan/LPS O-acetylase OafA/YrhL
VTRIQTEGHAPIARQGKIADIEMLRGIAIIFVLIEHTRINLFPWIWGPETRLYFYFGFWSGVDLFFAISGFVITRSLLPMLEMTTGTAAFFNATLSFWVRRVWRLLPSAWLWLAVILVSAVFFNRSGVFWSFRANLESAIAALLDVANFRIAIVYGKADPGAAFPYWSLSLEEQFYILLPIALFFAGRRLPWVLAVGIVAQFFIRRIGPHLSDFGMLLNMLRSEALMMGVLLAIWSRKATYGLFEPTGLKGRPLTGLALLTLLTAVLAAVGGPGLTVVSFTIGLVALISAVLVFLASYDQDYLMPRGPWKDVMLWVGSRSYALYLIHIPVFFLTREFWFRIEPPGTVFNSTFALPLALTAFPLLIILAELNYRFLEVPLRRHGVRIAQRIEQRVIGSRVALEA